uniref:Uncharacterized protein n=1 Tax=Ralstonia solanacearum TaxID=305 RepID=A0A0S4UHL9_RALSL|nr:protein of unknown function [Ralstonia solanacearum]CUV27884.1 protein of unknown function [Ralstonia solanacearum]CUV33592.1 protein of unknown function [Ralstonia solanacearum]CUV38188.1 protein of unknown function [Ralstonia solanacearum]CUV43328.1 protein of unknown function [Ralstonia solanacearum]
MLASVTPYSAILPASRRCRRNRHGRHRASRIAAPMVIRYVTVPAAPSAGNRVLAKELPTQTEAMEPSSASIGIQSEGRPAEDVGATVEGEFMRVAAGGGCPSIAVNVEKKFRKAWAAAWFFSKFCEKMEGSSPTRRPSPCSSTGAISSY